jgi:hypothetical protein
VLAKHDLYRPSRDLHWQSNIYAPPLRTVSPKSILAVITGDAIANYPDKTSINRNAKSLSSTLVSR